MVRRIVGVAVAAVALLQSGTSAAQPAPSTPPAPSAPPAATPSAPAATSAATAATAPLPPVPPPAVPDMAFLAEVAAGQTFQQGREAFKAGDFARALDLFLKSQAMQASAGTLLNIALTEEKLGKTASAWQNFQRVVEQFKADDDRMPIARDGVARTAPRVPRMKLERAAGAPPTLSIKVDGSPLAANLVGAEQALDPGAHFVTTFVTGFEERRYDVTLSEGQRLVLVLEPGKRTMLAEPVGPAGGVAAPSSSLPQLAAFALGGAGLAGLGMGLATGVLAISKKGDLDAACPSPPTCSAAGRRLEGEAHALADISTGTLIFGGVAAAAGVVVFVVAGSGRSARIATSATPGGAFVSAGASF